MAYNDYSYGGYAPKVGSQKMEEELAQAIKKALSPEETSPKQKHVRSCILYTWDMKGSGSLWNALKVFPMLSEDVIGFKAMILIHKVARQGHQNALKDLVAEHNWLDGIGRASSFQGSYAQLIQMYIAFLKSKLQYHKFHPYFSGTFDYEEYVSLKGIEDPNEGYETIFELLELLEKIQKFQKLIFSNLRSYGGHNEARIGALVPLVEESYGIYQFIVSMMTAMHTSNWVLIIVIGSVEVLGPLRDSFKTHHYELVQFYDDCNQIRYLTSLISIPKLSSEPPNFLAQGPPKQQPRNAQKNNDAEKEKERERERERQRKLEEEREMKERQRLLEQQQEQYERELQQQREAELKRMQELQLREQEQLRLQMQQQEQYNLGQQLEFYRQQSLRDRETLGQYELKVNQLQQELNRALQNQSGDAQKNETITRLTNEVDQWKTKYEALAKLYAQLRKEHLDLLTKFKALKDSGAKTSEEARKNLEKAQAELKAKANELTEVIVERNRLKGDTDRIRLQYEEEFARLRKELEQSKAALTEMSLTRGTEVQSLVARFTQEQQNLENILQGKQMEIAQLTNQLQDVLSAMEKSKLNYEEETSVLQAGLDQALEILRQHQMESESGMGARDERIQILEGKHQQLLDQMMDNVLQTCVTTVSESLFQLDSIEEGAKVSPEFVLSLIERAQQRCTEFSTSFVKFVNGGDPKDAVTTSSAFAQSIAELLRSGKAAIGLAQEESDGDEIHKSLGMTGQAAIQFFEKVKSAVLAQVPAQKKPEYIVNISRETQQQVSRATPLLEKIAGSKNNKIEGDLGDAVESAMGAAFRAIEEAGKRLEALLQSQGPNLNVNSAILQAAIAITTAIANLIKCATASQQEIVAQNKGNATSTAFYKKNNKWTEGLISAAQSVSTSTVYLVEVADGLVQGTKSWEQLVVAAQDVNVSTTQLVAASRVKATLYSKTQDRLEAAAVQVREATKLLVKAAKDASKLSAERDAREQVGKMSKHEAKVKEMEQQVKILELEKELQTARYTLGEMRKAGYHEEV
ncbi:sla2 Src-like adaptor 2 [Boothiomyces sp. JEL0838]|nr:sla2 Src-like adaptor 2 [Boothiomyces sp. JEL0838]